MDKKLTFEHFFGYLKSTGVVKNTHQSTYIEDDDDESVRNPFTDSSDSKDSDWDPGSDSDSSTNSNCSENVCKTTGAIDETTNKGETGLTHKRSKLPCSTLHDERIDDDDYEGPSNEWSQKPLSATCPADDFVVEDSRSSVGSEIFPALKAACEEIPKVSIAKRVNMNNIWDKKHSCMYCHKAVNKMSTHLQRLHKNESEVVRVLAMIKGSSERRLAWAELLNQGDYQHNYKVLESGFGQLIPKYRTKNRSVEDCVMCSFCKGLYGKSLLYLHSKTCSKRKDYGKKGKGQAVRQGSMLMPLPNNVSERFFNHVVSRMLKDDITKIVLNDSLIVRFGERKFYATDVEEHTPGHLSSRIRELGRLLKIVRQKTDMAVSTLTQALHPQNFDLLVQSVRELAEFDEEQHHFKKGSLALRLGHSIKKSVSVLKAEAIKNEDDDLITQANKFDSLFTGDWFDYISANAGQSVYKARFNKPKLLPACADIEKVHVVLDEQMKSNDYATCTKATLCSVSLFNRKRGGEVQRLKVDDFEKGMQCGVSNPEAYENLSELEKKLVTHFNRIEIRGKFCRKVPILLTSNMVDSIHKIISFRKQQNPPIESKYLFSTKTGERPYRGSDVIREFAKKAEVSDVSLFTFTHLRKQVATLSQTLQITKWEQDQLATFLGHDIRVHRNIYRQPLEVLDRAKVAKVLLAVNKGVSIDFECGVDENDELNCETHDDNQPDLDEELDSEDETKETKNHKTKQDDVTAVLRNPKVNGTQRPKNINNEEPKTCQRMKRRPWSENEVAAVKRHLSQCIASGNVPRKDQALKAVTSEPSLRMRSWRNVKDFVYNLIKKQNKV